MQQEHRRTGQPQPSDAMPAEHNPSCAGLAVAPEMAVVRRCLKSHRRPLICYVAVNLCSCRTGEWSGACDLQQPLLVLVRRDRPNLSSITP